MRFRGEGYVGFCAHLEVLLYLVLSQKARRLESRLWEERV